MITSYMNPIQIPAAVSCERDRWDIFIVGNNGTPYERHWYETMDLVPNNQDPAGWAPLGDPQNIHMNPNQFVGNAPIGAIPRDGELINLFAVMEGGGVHIRSGKCYHDDDGGHRINWSENDWRDKYGNFVGHNTMGWYTDFGRSPFPGYASINAVSRTYDSNLIDLFGVGIDKQIYTASLRFKPDRKQTSPYNCYLEEWSGWAPIGGSFLPGAPISAVSRESKIIDIFGAGTDGQVWTMGGSTENADALRLNWSPPWQMPTLAVAPGSPVSAVTRGKNLLDVFVVSMQGETMTSYWPEPTAPEGWFSYWKPFGGLGGFVPGSQISVLPFNESIYLFAINSNQDIQKTVGVNFGAMAGQQPVLDFYPWEGYGGGFTPGAPVSVVTRDRSQSFHAFYMDADTVNERIYGEVWKRDSGDWWTSFGVPS